jgi:ABC-type multidrug transport system fused ATPase/permease subunit
MVTNILRSKILFYDSNPIGRIATRFTKDISSTDQTIPFLIMMVSRGCIRAGTIVVSVAVVNPYVLVVCAFGGVYIKYVYGKGIRPTIDCIRLNKVF